MTDEEATQAVVTALAREGRQDVSGLLVSSLRGKGGIEVVLPSDQGGPGASFYVQEDSGEVFRMPSAASSAPAFEDVISPDHRGQWKVGA